MAKVLAAQTRTLEFNSHNPLKKLGTEACACNSSTQNEERDGLRGLTDKPVQPKPGAADPSGRHSLKNQSRYFLTNNARGWPLPSTHTHHVLISLTLPREAHRPRSESSCSSPDALPRRLQVPFPAGKDHAKQKPKRPLQRGVDLIHSRPVCSICKENSVRKQATQDSKS